MEKVFTLTESQIRAAFGYRALEIDNATVFYDYKSYDQGGFNYPELVVYITIIDGGDISSHYIDRGDEEVFGLDREHFFMESTYSKEREKAYIKQYAELFIETKVESVYGGNGIEKAWEYARKKVAEKEED